MPYQHVADLPESVRTALPKGAQQAYKEAFNKAWADSQAPDEKQRTEIAHQIALAAVQGQGEQNMTDKVENTLEAVDEQIKSLVRDIRESQSIIGNEETRIQQAKEKLAALLMERGSNWQDEAGYARLLTEGTRISYNTAALDDLILKQPSQYGWLNEYRVESPIASRIQVK